MLNQKMFTEHLYLVQQQLLRFRYNSQNLQNINTIVRCRDTSSTHIHSNTSIRISLPNFKYRYYRSVNISIFCNQKVIWCLV